ncbi:hypothetical protein NKG94_05065 [Micromonospora sp. M12]
MLLVEQHDVALFEGTLRANLSAGAHVDDDVLRAAVRLPRPRTCSPRTRTDSTACSPSGVQPVRRAATADRAGARARRRPPVLVLHNPTTAVDAVTEGLLAEGLASARGER